MTDFNRSGPESERGATYRVAGALTITRAATTQRELDALPDPLTIDLSDIHRMDTVGAWLVYRAVRDRGAKVIGASHDEVSLVKKVSDFDVPAKVHPDERGDRLAALRPVLPAPPTSYQRRCRRLQG